MGLLGDVCVVWRDNGWEGGGVELEVEVSLEGGHLGRTVGVYVEGVELLILIWVWLWLVRVDVWVVLAAQHDTEDDADYGANDQQDDACYDKHLFVLLKETLLGVCILIIGLHY
jgi:hypothetical protein